MAAGPARARERHRRRGGRPCPRPDVATGVSRCVVGVVTAGPAWAKDGGRRRAPRPRLAARRMASAVRRTRDCPAAVGGHPGPGLLLSPGRPHGDPRSCTVRRGGHQAGPGRYRERAGQPAHRRSVRFHRAPHGERRQADGVSGPVGSGRPECALGTGRVGRHPPPQLHADSCTQARSRWGRCPGGQSGHRLLHDVDALTRRFPCRVPRTRHGRSG